MNDELDPEQAPWLDAARRQAGRLADVRLQAPRALLRPLARPASLTWLRTSLAFILLASVVATGAWAFRSRVRGPAPAPAAPVRGVAPAARVLTRQVSTPLALEPAARVAKRKLVKDAPPARPPVMQKITIDELEGPEDEVIYGRSPSKQPPLFDVGEYKARGLLVR